VPDFSIISQAPDVRAIVQDGLLERAFQDGLYPKVLYRLDVMPQAWGENLGDNRTFTGVGLMQPDLQPLVPGSDPDVADFPKEQWSAQLQQYAKSIDVLIPDSVTAIANLFLRNAQQLGLQAGQTLNRGVRDAMFRAGLSGITVCDGAQGPTNTIRVARLNGLTRARRPDLPAGSPVRFDLVTSANPLPIVVNAPGPTARNIIAFTPDVAGDEVGPGTVTLDGAIIAVVDRALFRANDGSFIVNVGGGPRIDDITSANLLRLADLRSAVARLRQQNVPVHPDGRYHCHIDPTAEAQVFSDPEAQRMLTSLPDYYMYQAQAIGQIQGTAFFTNTESPLPETVVAAPTSFVAPSANFSQKDPFPGELINPTGVRIHRTMFTAQGGIMEYYKDLFSGSWVTEAGLTGKFAAPQITNNAIEVFTERIQYVLRAPLDRLQQKVSASWRFVGDWPVRTDVTTGDRARFKRFCVVQSGE
jgi:hypothetical protein